MTIGNGTIKGPAGVFGPTDRGVLLNPVFASLSNCAVEFWIRPTAEGRIFRIGSTTTGNAPGIDIRIENGVWAVTKTTAAGSQVSDGTAGVVLGLEYHVVCVFSSGVNNLIYINGEPIPLTHGATATGAILVNSADELAIGDPTVSTRTGFSGTLGRVFFWPFAPSATWIKASYRVQADQVGTLGISAENVRGVANRGPVAVPFDSSSVVAGSPIDIDVAVRAFDPNANLLTASIPSPPTQGTASIVANKVRYTPQGGTGGQTHRVAFRVADAALSSTSVVDVPITAPTIGPDIPITANNVFVSSVGDLRENLLDAYAGMAPNTTLWLPPGVYDLAGAATWSFFKAGGSVGQPFIIRPQNDNWLSVRFTDRVLISGGHHQLHGIDFANVNGTNITLDGPSTRASRCRIIHTGNATCQGVLMQRSAGIRCDRNEVSIDSGAYGSNGQSSGESICLRLGPTALLPDAPLIEKCWVHDCDGLPNKTNANAREGIQVGEGSVSGQVAVRAIVRNCLLHNVTNESEPVSVKSSFNQLTNIILTGSGGSRNLVSRAGNNNTWTACRTTGSGGFRMWQRNHLYVGCETDSSGRFQLLAGNATAAEHEADLNNSAKNRPAAENCETRHCTGGIEIQEQSGSAFTSPIVNCKFRTHSGTLTNVTPSLGSSFTRTEDAPGTKPTITNLVGGNTAATNVGPFAP